MKAKTYLIILLTLFVKTTFAQSQSEIVLITGCQTWDKEELGDWGDDKTKYGFPVVQCDGTTKDCFKWVRIDERAEDVPCTTPWHVYVDPRKPTGTLTLYDYGSMVIASSIAGEDFIFGLDTTEESFRFDDLQPLDDPRDPEIKLSDLIDYQTECYNDSTEVTQRSFYDCGRPFCLVDHGIIYKTVWRHREPTFAGFIQYLKSKQ